MIDILLLVLILGYCAFIIYSTYFKKKKSGCSGTCAGCSSASLCHIDFNKIYKEIKEEECHG